MTTHKFSTAAINKLRRNLAVLVAMRGDERYCQDEVTRGIKAIEYTLSVVVRN